MLKGRALGSRDSQKSYQHRNKRAKHRGAPLVVPYGAGGGRALGLSASAVECIRCKALLREEGAVW